MSERKDKDRPEKQNNDQSQCIHNYKSKDEAEAEAS